VLTYLCAVLASIANAAASVLQRKANKDIPHDEQLSLRLVRDLLREPVWFAGVAAVTCGFLLQAAALRNGGLSVVEPVLVIELPITVVLAWRVFSGRMTRREWTAVGGMTLGLVGLLYFLAPSGGHAQDVAGWTWATAIGVSVVLLVALVEWGRRMPGEAARAGIYGVATGLGFGLTAALMKGMTEGLRHGFVGIFTTWQTYAMVAAGAVSMYLLQNALNAGRLVAAQPGITLTDPVVSVLWGALVFGEQVRHGWYTALAAVSAVLVVGSVVALARSPLLRDETAASNPYAEAADGRDADAADSSPAQRARLAT
jgi:drug/metabolite transporter (DMT)-like permease